jgi:hypothetical protein
MPLKPEIFAVIWHDNMLALTLTLHKPDAQSAIAAARSMRERGADKITRCRAVHLAADSDILENLEP